MCYSHTVTLSAWRPASRAKPLHISMPISWCQSFKAPCSGPEGRRPWRL